ncbi:MAG: hypothetical protein Q8P59_12945, partial [Dehalococcoidia bacterium]|nr:hypothetical protein [Dehalococcoidia bacterium]
MSRRKRVLFIENSTGIGGSTISLFRLVSRLRDGPYRPLVIFYRENGYVSRFKELGVEVAILNRQPPAAGRSSSRPVDRRAARII